MGGRHVGWGGIRGEGIKSLSMKMARCKGGKVGVWKGDKAFYDARCGSFYNRREWVEGRALGGR